MERRAAPTADLSAQPIVWRPGPAQLDRSRMLAFTRRHGLADYDALVEHAANDPSWFGGAPRIR